MSERTICAECGLPMAECSSLATARIGLKESLRDYGYSWSEAKEAASRLIPHRRLDEPLPIGGNVW